MTIRSYRKLAWIAAATLLILSHGARAQAADPAPAQAAPDDISQRVHPGDEVRIVTHAGHTLNLRVTKVEQDSLTGSADTGKHYRVQYSAIREFEVTVGAPPAGPATTEQPPATHSAWLGVNAGLAIGWIDLRCPGAACNESGLLGTYGLNLTYAGALGVRLRGVRGNEPDRAGDNPKEPFEAAVLVGPRLGASGSYLLIGLGTIRNPDDEYPRDHATGLAWEFLIADRKLSGVGFEASILGNHLGDAQYLGISLGMRFGSSF